MYVRLTYFDLIWAFQKSYRIPYVAWGGWGTPYPISPTVFLVFDFIIIIIHIIHIIHYYLIFPERFPITQSDCFVSPLSGIFLCMIFFAIIHQSYMLAPQSPLYVNAPPRVGWRYTRVSYTCARVRDVQPISGNYSVPLQPSFHSSRVRTSVATHHPMGWGLKTIEHSHCHGTNTPACPLVAVVITAAVRVITAARSRF